MIYCDCAVMLRMLCCSFLSFSPSFFLYSSFFHQNLSIHSLLLSGNKRNRLETLTQRVESWQSREAYTTQKTVNYQSSRQPTRLAEMPLPVSRQSHEPLRTFVVDYFLRQSDLLQWGFVGRETFHGTAAHTL